LPLPGKPRKFRNEMTNNLPSVAVLISGRGSNLKSLIEGAKCYRVTEVISNTTQAAGLKIAEAHGIKTSAFDRVHFDTLIQQKNAIYEATLKTNPDYILLAGFMQIVEGEFVDKVYGKLINIHPSLLPAFPGLHPHEKAIKAGAKEHGCTVHVVDSGVDTGPIIAQIKVAVDPKDTEDSLAAKVLVKEHSLYPWVINNLALKKITINNRTINCRSINYSKDILDEATSLGIILNS